MTSPRALALPVAAGVAVAIVTFAIVMAVDGGDDERGGAGQAAGRDLFFQMGCGSCHELAVAGSSGTIGPSLDERLAAHDASSLRAAILNPPGNGVDTFSVMPENFGARMSDRELDVLVDYLLAAVGTRRERSSAIDAAFRGQSVMGRPYLSSRGPVQKASPTVTVRAISAWWRSEYGSPSSKANIASAGTRRISPEPPRYWSTTRAQRRPSAIAVTTSDWPTRESPQANTPSIFVP
jgi:cytochrome c551/c552